MKYNHQANNNFIGKQKWTLSGYPIVDGKYLDNDGNIREMELKEWTNCRATCIKYTLDQSKNLSIGWS